jgi:23S rRNA pseudouridine2605 synthase
MAKDRLQKIIAQAGLCSRRQAEELIKQGQVKVNGQLVSELGVKADPTKDRIEVRGKKLLKEERRYILLHKPIHCVTTSSDDRGRDTVFDHIKGVSERLFSVGRLDFDTEGLLLLTNDGELAHGLTHPSSQTPKVYQVKVEGNPSLETLEQLQMGVLLEDGPATATEVFMVNPGHRVSKRNTWLQLTVTEGRNRMIRRMMEQVGHPVMRLRRVGFASLELTDALRPGAWRNLKADEVKKLKKSAQAAIAKRKKSQEQSEAQLDEWGFEF